jgi:hypothetical protein
MTKSESVSNDRAQIATLRHSSVVLRNFLIRRFAESGRLSCAFRIRNSVSWVFNLLANGCEELGYSRLAHTIGDERWDKSTSVGVNEIRGASSGVAIGLE